MRDIAEEIGCWINNRERFALAMVTCTWGSSPRPVGSVMVVREDMQIAGSVSGGCIENAVIEEAVRVIETGAPKMLRFGVTDETALSVGLSCGGTIHVYVEPYVVFSEISAERDIGQKLLEGLQNNQPMVLITRLDSLKPKHFLFFPEDGSFFGELSGHRAVEEVKAASRAFHNGSSGESEIAGESVFLLVLPRRDRLVIIGATHISIPLVKYARELGFETIIIDPRKVFANRERFSVQPDNLITEWPEKAFKEFDLNEDTYTVLLTHDPKIDDPALKVLLKSPVAYIGALGSRRTHERRLKRLLQAGFDDSALARIHGPVGLDISAQTPSEIALSIVAQITKIKNQRRKINAG